MTNYETAYISYIKMFKNKKVYVVNLGFLTI